MCTFFWQNYGLGFACMAVIYKKLIFFRQKGDETVILRVLLIFTFVMLEGHNIIIVVCECVGR